MVWTAPRTWVTSEVVTAAIMNADHRDNLLALDQHKHTGAAGDGANLFGSVFALLRDDFIAGTTTSGEIGELQWSTTSGTLAQQAGEANHPGILRRGLNSTVGSGCSFYLVGTPLLPADNFDLTWIVRLGQNDTTFDVRAGLSVSGTVTTQPTDGIYAERLAADTQWFGVCRAASAQTRSAGQGNSSLNFARLRMRRVNGTTIGFSLDGGTEQTVAANVPTAALTPWLALITQQASANKTIDIDLFLLNYQLTR